MRIEKATSAFGALNLLIGAAGLTGPAVWGNDDRAVNIRPGKLLGVVAINAPHALLHVGVGAAALAASRDADLARRFMGAESALFAALAVIGTAHVRNEPGIHVVMGMAIDRMGNGIHAAWTAFGLKYARS